MFDQYKALKSLSALMGNREEIQRKMDEFQAELGKKTVEADAGAGAVRVTVNGRMEVLRVELDPAMIATLSGSSEGSGDAGDQVSGGQSSGGGGDEDKAMMEELIAGAVNEAMRRAQALAKEEMAKAAGGLNLPGLEGLMGQGGV